ncbi:hypothetical protein C9426_10100 [Serratia sp. S1B]|nr:hypothetical protein C9426_10100 [Serratia sp. S1B]
METKFNDLKAKHLQLVTAQVQLRNNLQEKASVLVQEYFKSLSLPADRWFIAQNEPRAYVEIGVLNAKGEFEPAYLPRLQLDSNYRLNFLIVTTLDDTPITGGYRHGVSVSLYYEGAKLYALVGAGDDASTFAVPSKPEGFSEVCEAIKSLIIAGIDKSMPKVVLESK